MHKVLAQMRDVFEKDNLVADRDTIEQNQMLMQLPHIADMRHDRNAKLAAEQAHNQKLAHPGHPQRIDNS
jgi:hypothetical protein